MLRAMNWRRCPERQTRAFSRRRPLLELLEDRCVPAGNVFAGAFGGNLLLFGDDFGNGIHVADGAQPGEVVVTGTDGTTINGADSQTFQNIGSLHAELFGGDDTLLAENFTMAGFGFATVLIDGGAGDDRIELVDTSMLAFDSVNVLIYGERMFPGAAPTTGNDTIRLSGVTIAAEGFGFASFVHVEIHGELNAGAEVTGGNDTIVVQDSVIRAASRGFTNIVNFNLIGNYSAPQPGTTSVIGEGNDTITLSRTTLSAAGSFSSNTAIATIVGDRTEVRGHAASSIGGGNDRITVQDSQISTQGALFQAFNVSRLDIRGDWNLVEGSLDASTSSTIGGGNDRITVSNVDVAASGEFGGSNNAIIDIAGEFIQLFGPAGSDRLSSIGGGNDSITVADTDITLDGSGFDFAGLILDGERHENFDPAVSFIGGGNDNISVLNVQLIGHPTFDNRLAFIRTGAGNDRLEVIDSLFNFIAVDMGDGNDSTTFNDNIFGEASLSGGNGNDKLDAHGNLGLLIFFGYDDADVTP